MTDGATLPAVGHLTQLTIDAPSHGLVRVQGTVEEVADMLVRAGYPKDAERLLAAQARRQRRALRRLPC